MTGATSGIGRATAIALASGGARVIVTGRDAEALAAVRDATGGTAVAADLGNSVDVERLAAAALSGPAPVEILVNNAGVGWAGSFAAMPPEMIEELVAVNLLGTARLTRALLPTMLERRRGHIVMVASVAGHVGVRDEALYAATKAAMLSLSESLRYELRDAGVRVTSVSPGVVDTPFFTRRGSAYSRRRPQPIPPERLARAIVRAIRARARRGRGARLAAPPHLAAWGMAASLPRAGRAVWVAQGFIETTTTGATTGNIPC